VENRGLNRWREPCGYGMVTVFRGSQVIASNSGWSGTPQASDIRTATQRIGAFPLAEGSGDCAVILQVGDGNYTVHIDSISGTVGIALLEVYDLDVPEVVRLVNLSTLARVETGDGVLIGGLVITGNLKKYVLIRAAGPTLSQFGIQAPLAHPVVTVLSGNVPIGTAGAWGNQTNAAQIKSVADYLGAFGFPPGSNDAAMFIQLDPGAYTLQVSGADGGTGVGLLEVYEAP
jgi:hypothetical protein